MQRYLQPDALKDLGVYHFDRWASTFGQIEDNLELSTDGNSYRMKSRFCKFHNMTELTKLFYQVADIKMIEDLDIERPILKTGKPIVISVEAGYEVMMYIKELSKRAEAVKSGIDPAIDNMLKITMEGKAIAIDHRILDPLAVVDRDSSKVYKLTENVYSIYKREEKNRGFQTVFLDFGIVMYDIIKKDLVDKGMKPEEIEFIHNFKTDKAKDELFKMCRSGEVRVLIGSTSKMSAGTNIQDRMIALHHLDCPWRPSDIAQRNGRIQRQGNMYKEVEVYQYVTKSTFDIYLWQIQEQKQTFISQIITNKIGVRSCEDIDDTLLNFSEIKAIACGNPLIKGKMQLEIDVKKLNILKSSYIKELSIYRDKIKFNPNLIIKTKDIINDIKADIKEFDTSILKDFSINLRNKVYLKRATCSEVLKDLLLKVQIGGKEKLGNYHNFNVECIRIDFHNIKLIMKGNHSYSIPLAESPVGNITRIENINLKLDKDLSYKISSLNKLEKDLIVAKEMVSKPFEKEDILIDKIKKLNKINTEINKVDISREEYLSEETTSKNRGI